MLEGTRALIRRGMRRIVLAGLPPALVGWRHVRRVTAEDWVARRPETGETLLAPAVARNPLPRNIAAREELDPDPGWWGFSFRDVPERRSGPVRLLRVGRGRIVTYGGPGHDDEFHPAILVGGTTSFELDQIVFRHPHGAVLRRRPAPERFGRATWVLERVYHNHAHWLTAHLPKLVLLRDRGQTGNVLMPRQLTPVMEASLAMLGLDPLGFPRFEPGGVLEIEALTLVQSDRFRPELLRPVRDALSPAGARRHRQVFVSRARARSRRLIGEDALWPALRSRGFERIFMEELDFPAQVRVMAETVILVAPHGAGLTNMMFCSNGAHVVEIADAAYPNPNFYALASAMGLGYWLVHAEGVGTGHPLFRDLDVRPEAVLAAVDRARAEVAEPPLKRVVP